MQLDKVCAVITGGASGMGRATAEALVAEGAKVCIVDFNQERCEEAAAAMGDAAYYECADVSDPAKAEEIVKNAVEKFGYVNVVINCAGVGSGSRILPRDGGVFPLDSFKKIIDINLIGTFNYICYGALAMSTAPENEDGERGVIISVTSQALELGQIGQAAYSASKGAVSSMTLPIARELARYGIRINTIAPGLVVTNMTNLEHIGKPRPPLPEGDLDPAAKDIIFPRRRGKASEFASLAVEVIRNSLINGASLPLDGAIRFSPKW